MAVPTVAEAVATAAFVMYRYAISGVMGVGKVVRRSASLAASWPLRILSVLACAAMLSACSKCDVPAWQQGSTGADPAACHDGPQTQ